METGYSAPPFITAPYATAFYATAYFNVTPSTTMSYANAMADYNSACYAMSGSGSTTRWAWTSHSPKGQWFLILLAWFYKSALGWTPHLQRSLARTQLPMRTGRCSGPSGL
jgi:hypothetical protein